MRANFSGLFKLDPNNVFPMDQQGNFTAGDLRFGQTTVLALTYSLFFRLHNMVARNLQAVNPHWTDDQLFFESRRITIAIYQHIIYWEWLPVVMGRYYFFLITFFNFETKISNFQLQTKSI